MQLPLQESGKARARQRRAPPPGVLHPPCGPAHICGASHQGGGRDIAQLVGHQAVQRVTHCSARRQPGTGGFRQLQRLGWGARRAYERGAAALVAGRTAQKAVGPGGYCTCSLGCRARQLPGAVRWQASAAHQDLPSTSKSSRPGWPSSRARQGSQRWADTLPKRLLLLLRGRTHAGAGTVLAIRGKSIQQGCFS